jgi:tryptophan synthase alpha chain
MQDNHKISAAFDRDRAALMPYFTLGYPDYETSLDVIQACVEAGADLMELGVPFSDPLADGPTIQHSTQVALHNGVTVGRCLEAVAALRVRGVDIPLILMGYLNPFMAYGLERFVAQAARAGANGFIIPDLPPQEAGQMQDLCRPRGLDCVFLLAPNSSEARMRFVAQRSRGFVYLVSVLGITGGRAALPPELADFVARARAQTDKPLAVGFGISTPEQAGAVGRLADGVIVGSALVKAVGGSDDPVGAAGDFVRRLKAGMRL